MSGMVVHKKCIITQNIPGFISADKHAYKWKRFFSEKSAKEFVL